MGYTDEERYHREQTLLGAREQAHADYLADRLRMSFITKWALRANLDLYKTDCERDWAYIVRREHRYLVTGRSLADAAFVCSLGQCFATIQARQVRWWPWAALPFVAYAIMPYRYRWSNKRFFDMLNVGTEYELGAERNRVLEECNRLAKRADF